jgi:hypothetical protein
LRARTQPIGLELNFLYLFDKEGILQSTIDSAQASTTIKDVRQALVEAITALQAQPVSVNIHMTGVELNG